MLLLRARGRRGRGRRVRGFRFWGAAARGLGRRLAGEGWCGVVWETAPVPLIFLCWSLYLPVSHSLSRCCILIFLPTTCMYVCARCACQFERRRGVGVCMLFSPVRLNPSHLSCRRLCSLVRLISLPFFICKALPPSLSLQQQRPIISTCAVSVWCWVWLFGRWAVRATWQPGSSSCVCVVFASMLIRIVGVLQIIGTSSARLQSNFLEGVQS